MISNKKIVNYSVLISVIISAFFYLKKVGRELTNYDEKKIKVDSVEIIKTEFFSNLKTFNQKVQTDSRKDILSKLLENYYLVYESDNNKVLKLISDAQDYYEWINIGNEKVINESILKLEKYKQNNVEKNDKVNRLIMELELNKGTSSTSEITTSMLIREMRNLISIKMDCKYINSNGEIKFYDTSCKERFDLSISKIEKSIENINSFKKAIKPKK